MKLKTIIAALLFAALLVPLAAQDVTFSGDVETLWGAAAPWTDKDTTAGRFTVGNTAFTGKIDAWIDNSSAYVEGTVGYDATRALNNASGAAAGAGNSGFGASSSFGADGLNLSLNEAWIDYSDALWGIRIGRQKDTWGAADGIDVTNVICPSNMSGVSSLFSGSSKLAVDAVRLSLYGDSFTADAWWLPFFTPSALPLDEGNALRRFVVPATAELPVSQNTTLTIPVSIGTLSKPETAIWNGEYALKVSGYFSAFDASFYGFYGWDDTPLLDYTLTYSGSGGTPTPNGITVSGGYERMGMIGADASLPIGETVLRLETAVFPQRHFQKSAEKIITEKMTAAATAAATGTTPAAIATSEKHTQLSALAGLDWMPSDWTITAQYYCDAVFGNLDALDRTDAYNHGMTLNVSKTFLDETLEASLTAVVGFNAFDTMISPSVKYSLSDQISVNGGAYIFTPGPDKDGQYGAYKDLSTFYASAKFSF